MPGSELAPPSVGSDWPAPTAESPVDAEIRVPGSKSATNRALVLSALAAGRSRLNAPLRSRDTELMVAALRTLGVPVADDGPDWLVTGCPDPLEPLGSDVDVGNAGTVARFVTPVAALARGTIRVDGDPRMRERPLGPLLDALTGIGADIDDGGRGALPVVVRGTGRLAGGPVRIDTAASSQFVSGLLLAAPRFLAGVDVTHDGARLPSRPHLAMTVAMLREFGADVEEPDPTRWRVAPGRLTGRDVRIEPDLSSAAPFLAAALATAGTVRLAGWPSGSTQPGARLPELLTAMGATCRVEGGALIVRGGGRIVGLDADLGDVSELAPVLAALAALADTPSRLHGIGHSRGQETDRIAALAGELGGLGADVAELADGLEFRPARLHGGRFATYEDHRLAMAAAVLGLVVPGIEVENIETTGKTLPGFVGLWSALLGTGPAR
ncbi:MAG TPA: 3-phosphoshikimate 1-carboxyvinyltransferase [Mycobacteriales bacterium]|nr:3-phosphoshikimate 1-carboxyvinyltransferase [Mycobacteriales bacterium]